MKTECHVIRIPNAVTNPHTERRAYVFLPDEFYIEDKATLFKYLDAIFLESRPAEKVWHTPGHSLPCPACDAPAQDGGAAKPEESS